MAHHTQTGKTESDELSLITASVNRSSIFVPEAVVLGKAAVHKHDYAYAYAVRAHAAV